MKWICQIRDKTQKTKRKTLNKKTWKLERDLKKWENQTFKQTKT